MTLLMLTTRTTFEHQNITWPERCIKSLHIVVWHMRVSGSFLEKARVLLHICKFQMWLNGMTADKMILTELLNFSVLFFLYYKRVLWLSGNPLHVNMGTQWHILLTEGQCSLSQHTLHADMPAKCNVAPSCLTLAWSTVLHVPEAVHVGVWLN